MKAMNRKKQTFLILAALVLVFAATALAQGPADGRTRGHGRGFGAGFDPEHRLEVMTDKLDLTPEQVEAIGAIQEKNHAEALELRKEMKRLQNELEGELLKDEPSETTAVGLVEKIGDLRTRLQTQRMESRLAVREQLTDEQRDKMLMMKDRHGRRGARGKGGRFGNSCDRACDGHGRHRGGRQAGEG